MSAHFDLPLEKRVLNLGGGLTCPSCRSADVRVHTLMNNQCNACQTVFTWDWSGNQKVVTQDG